MAEWRHWQSWYRECALAGCETDARLELQGFALARWRRYAAVCVGMTNLGQGELPELSAADAWHAFETLVRLRHTRAGKAYKHWLFARVAPDAGVEALDVIQGGAALIMRDVVREFFRREMSRRGTLSLNASPPGTPPSTPSLGELLPAPGNPAHDVVRRDIEALGALTAESLGRRTLPRRARVAILARDMGLSLAHPAVTSAAGCRKSVLCTAWHDALKTIAATVNQRFGDEDRATRATLAIATLQALKPQLRAWALSENILQDFFHK